jgi:hypothetical protein
MAQAALRRALAVGLLSGLLVVTGCMNGDRVGPSSPAGGAGGSTGGARGGGAGGGSGGGGAQTGSGGSGSGGAPTSGTGGSGAGGAGGSGAGGAPGAVDAGPTCTLPTVAETCARVAPRRVTLIDFSSYTAAGTWGLSANGDLTGGTSAFQGAGVTPLARVVQGAAPDTQLHVTGTIAVGSYAGFVLWFGPCVNASTVMDTAGPATTTGLALPLGGSLGGTRFKLQVQTNSDYPVDPANMKGGCLYQTCATMWSDCVGPTATMTAVPASPALTSFPWAAFTGGLPAATTNGDGVVGLQLQFECVTPPSCNVDVTLGAVVLTL